MRILEHSATMKGSDEELIGHTLRGKWKVDALLGVGGMAKVFAATHRNGMRGAIKILRPQLESDDSLRERLVREGYVANRIQHPGVVRVLDDDVTDDGRAFIVMELLDGDTWKGIWTREGKSLPADRVLDVAAEVLSILDAAHKVGVIHRDVKPDNVFITRDGEVKLLDFGIARLREGAFDQTQTGAMLGTPAFMSPEQALARWSQVDLRSDLFSLAATMWVLLTGKFVHKCDTIPELLVATATRPAPSFVAMVPDAPQALVAAIDKGLGFDPKDRFQSAVEMREALLLARASLRREGRTVRPDAASSAVELPAIGDATEKMIVRGGTEVMPVAAAKEGISVPPPALDVTGTREAAIASAGDELPHADSTAPPVGLDSRQEALEGSISAPASEVFPVRRADRPRGFLSGIGLGAVAVVVSVGVTIKLSNPSVVNGKASGVASAWSTLSTDRSAAHPPSALPPREPAPSVASTASATVASAAPEHAREKGTGRLPRFDRGRANMMVANAAASAVHACSQVSGPRLVPVTVTYLPRGHVEPSVDSALLGSQSAVCVISMLAGVGIGPFEGGVETISTAVSLEPTP